jgi:hypothetical protein
MDDINDAPKEQERGKNLILYRSVFGIVFMVCRNTISTDVSCANNTMQAEPQKVLSSKSILFQPPEFIPAEAVGTKLPGRCPTCKNCRVPILHGQPFIKENVEYEITLSKLKLDEKRKKWVAAYPFNTYIEKLINNYSLARGCLIRMEGRFDKTGRTEEFNKHFQDKIDKGVCPRQYNLSQTCGPTCHLVFCTQQSTGRSVCLSAPPLKVLCKKAQR